MRLSDRYVGVVCLTPRFEEYSAHDYLEIIDRCALSFNLSYATYSNPDSLVAIFTSRQHLEPLISLTSKFDNEGLIRQNQSQVIFGAEVLSETGMLEGYPLDAHLLITYNRSSDLRGYSWYPSPACRNPLTAEYHLFYCLGNVSQLEIVATSLSDAFPRLHTVPSTVKSVKVLGLHKQSEHLASISTASESVPKKGTAGHYDPIEAYIRDLQKQCRLTIDRARSVEGAIAQLDYSHAILSNPSSYLGSLHELHYLLEHDAPNLDNLISSALESPLLRTLDLAKTTNALDDYCSEIEKSVSSSTSLVGTLPQDAFLMLHSVAEKLLLTLVRRIVFDPPSNHLKYENVSVAFGGTQWTIHENSPIGGLSRTIICLPLRYVYRVGFLPTLAHFVSHHCVSLNHKIEQDRSSRELVHDLIGCQLIGPAYAYSIARVMPPHVRNEEFTKPQFRIKSCVKYLESKGFTLNETFKSSLANRENELPTDKAEIVYEVARDCAEEVTAHDYDLDCHAKAIGEIRDALSQGYVLYDDGTSHQCDPTQLLNALWEEVVNGIGYVNEMALCFSLLSYRW